MKRFCILFLIFATLLCGCSDAEFYDASSSAAPLDSSGTESVPVGSDCMYEILPMLSDSQYVNGEFWTMCKIDLRTGLASPLCYDPACLHDLSCPAVDVNYFDATDDGKYVYFRKNDFTDPTEPESVLYVYRAETGEVEELDRHEFNSRHWVVVAFDDGVVFNKCVVTEKDEFGNELAFTNTLYKLAPDGTLRELFEDSRLFDYFRRGDKAYTLTKDGYIVFDSNLQEVQTIGTGATAEMEMNIALQMPFFGATIQNAEGEQEGFLYYRKEDGSYGRHSLSKEWIRGYFMHSMYWVIEDHSAVETPVEIGGVMLYPSLFTVRCIDPYTGQTVRKVDLSKEFDRLGITGISRMQTPTRRGKQGITGNYQMFTLTMNGIPSCHVLLNADTGEVLRIHFGYEE